MASVEILEIYSDPQTTDESRRERRLKHCNDNSKDEDIIPTENKM